MARTLNKYQILVSQRVGSKNVKNWAIEIRFAKNLLKLFPDENFWKEFNFPQVYSLGVLLYAENKEKIFRQYQAFTFTKASAESVSLTEGKAEADLLTHEKIKPKTLRDFLKN